MPIELILASASTARARLLRQAGLTFRIEPADIDEDAVKRRARQCGADAADCAQALANAKAQAVSTNNPGALVIGADQILVTGDEWYDKPLDLTAARRQLWSLRGRSHELATAAAAVRDGSLLWQAVSCPNLTMRPFSERLVDDYLRDEGEAVLSSVGAYRIEGRGVQLFSGINGDHFTVLGLPLLELLDFLRGFGLLQE